MAEGQRSEGGGQRSVKQSLSFDERLAQLTGSPDGISFEESLQAVAAHLHQQGKTYIEIGLDPKTKEIGWSFTATLNDSTN